VAGLITQASSAAWTARVILFGVKCGLTAPLTGGMALMANEDGREVVCCLAGTVAIRLIGGVMGARAL